MHACEMYLSRVFHYRYVSTTVVVVDRVIYKITRSPNELLKCLCLYPFYVYLYCVTYVYGTWGSATSRTVPGSIPGGVTGFFSDIFLSD